MIHASLSRRNFLARGAALATPLLLKAQNVTPAFVGPPGATIYNLSNSAFTPNLTTGDTYEITVAGAPNTAVSMCQQINGGSWSCYSRGTTDLNGAAVFTGQAGTLGQYNQGWYVGSQQAPMLKFWVYPSGSLNYGAINQQTTQAVLNALNALSGNTEHPANYTNLQSASNSFFSQLSNSNLVSMVTGALSNVVNVPSFSGSSYQSLVNSTESLLSWSAPTLDLESICQPSAAQVNHVNSASVWNSFSSAHLNACTLIANLLSEQGHSRRWMPRLRDGARLELARQGAALSATQSLGIASVGGVAIAGGVGLTNASGVTAATIFQTGSALAAATWWTGVTLIVVGVAWGGYWGYQAWTATGNNQPASNVGGSGYTYPYYPIASPPEDPE
jgi:hypothetical protein